ncbi:ABC transporter permease [Amycolatopsis carbonis]|uniref:ABC transporter permease n=1 Tax=Amycolatopsis carbonis TaxID=715471 RepID=A0A9Y2MXR3_9PSEU|nr:ABC transporter permease [Amycolatopsis sp. 2-15]WIX82601.1 ABC transporter permease [Amycolatopsis sp. 2-15]
MKRFLPVVAIGFAAFFAFGAVLAQGITAATLARGHVGHLDQISAVLAAFVLVAALTAVLVATTVFRITFAQRTGELALLRLLGAGRGRVAVRMIGEGVVTGLLASGAGVLAAFAVGSAAPLAGLPAPEFPWAGAVAVAFGGAGITALAVVSPAVAASGVAPLQALRESSVQDDGVRRVRLVAGALALLGAVVLLVSTLMSGLGDDARPAGVTESLLTRTVLSAALFFCAFACFGSVLMPGLLRVAGLLTRRFGAVGRLAVSGVGGAPRRAAAVTMSVALGVSVVIGSLAGAASMRANGETEMASSYPTDLELTGSFPSGYEETLRAAGLRHVLGYRRLDVGFTSATDHIVAGSTDVTLPDLPTADRLDVATGSLHGVVLGGALARTLHVSAGEHLRLEARGRSVEVTVGGTLHGSVPLGSAVLGSDVLDALGAPAELDGFLADGSERAVPAGNDIQVESLAQSREKKESWLGSLSVLAVVLLALTLVIAVVGIGATTSLSVLERVRESALLRAIGLSRRRLRTMITLESAVYGLLGSVLGLVIGLVHAWLAVLALGEDWPLRVPVLPLAAVVVALVVLSAAAGLVPARRAARVSPAAGRTDG